METQFVIEALTDEIKQLKVKLAMQSVDSEDRDAAERLFHEQQDEIAILSVELAAVRKSRDDFQNENNRLKRQVAMLQKKLKG